VANLIGSSESFGSAEVNWFGFVMMSKDLKEVNIIPTLDGTGSFCP